MGFSSFLLFPAEKPQVNTRQKTRGKNRSLVPVGDQRLDFPICIYYVNLSLEYIHPAANDVDSKYIEREHHRGRRVHVWTVNDKNMARDLFMNEVDGIFTDDPASMLEVLRLIHSPVT